VLHVVLDRFDDDDCVIDHDADGQHHAEQRQVLIVKPSSVKAAKVPTSETGTASIGITVARQFCRKRKTTIEYQQPAPRRRYAPLRSARP
jgi:hypothetical protein